MQYAHNLENKGVLFSLIPPSPPRIRFLRQVIQIQSDWHKAEDMLKARFSLPGFPSKQAALAFFVTEALQKK